ncbi:hypothetical protein C8R44DRAFT_895149 [Mycena epipterygia]|nr:hypothetical protein C8R44DRAFT_895149 [Mycena epipterygia]
MLALSTHPPQGGLHQAQTHAPLPPHSLRASSPSFTEKALHACQGKVLAPSKSPRVPIAAIPRHVSEWHDSDARKTDTTGDLVETAARTICKISISVVFLFTGRSTYSPLCLAPTSARRILRALLRLRARDNEQRQLLTGGSRGLIYQPFKSGDSNARTTHESAVHPPLPPLPLLYPSHARAHSASSALGPPAPQARRGSKSGGPEGRAY